MTLIGDAAHPMYPIGSNGASQGILDAEKLAKELERRRDVRDAFQAYEEERRPATANIVLMNRQNGPEQVMQIAEERAPEGFEDIESVIPLTEREEIALRYKMAGCRICPVEPRTSGALSILSPCRLRRGKMLRNFPWFQRVARAPRSGFVRSGSRCAMSSPRKIGTTVSPP